jgi:UDP-N-acetylmuramate dehydrogenase
VTRDTFAAAWARRLGPDRWHAQAPLAPLTTFRVGGPAEWLADVTSLEDLARLVSDARTAGVPVTMLGGGSNVLVADAGVRGVVVRLHATAITQPEAGLVRAEAGATMNGLVRWTVGRGLAGLEAWAGTPGTIGGAIAGNAHWGGGNIGDLVASVRVLARDGSWTTVPRESMGFAYDTSRLQRTGEIAVWADFGVVPGDPAALRARARDSLHYRKATQPLAWPSAGCVFQNPGAGDVLPPDVPRSAGALIDRAGLKGFRVGGARVSERHANFVVNDGSASSRDVRAVIEAARAAVRDRFGVVLRDEIVYLGTETEHG